MYLNVYEHHEAMYYKVIDVDKDEIINDVVWADDEKSEYCVYVCDETGLATNETKILKGNIKLVKMEE